MPTQISTILYISEYKEKTLSGFFVENAVGHMRFEKGIKYKHLILLIFILVKFYQFLTQNLQKGTTMNLV